MSFCAKSVEAGALLSFVGRDGVLAMRLLHGPKQACGCPDTAQPPNDTTQPIDAAGGFLQSQGAQPRFEAASKLSDDARMAMREGRVSACHISPDRLPGRATLILTPWLEANPQARRDHGSTQVQIIPISMFFEEFVDESGIADGS